MVDRTIERVSHKYVFPSAYCGTWNYEEARFLICGVGGRSLGHRVMFLGTRHRRNPHEPKAAFSPAESGSSTTSYPSRHLLAHTIITIILVGITTTTFVPLVSAAVEVLVVAVPDRIRHRIYDSPPSRSVRDAGWKSELRTGTRACSQVRKELGDWVISRPALFADRVLAKTPRFRKMDSRPCRDSPPLLQRWRDQRARSRPQGRLMARTGLFRLAWL